jgi:hypothetical protein
MLHYRNEFKSISAKMRLVKEASVAISFFRKVIERYLILSGTSGFDTSEAI